MNKELAIKFDFLYKRVTERYKAAEHLLNMLAERSDAEDKYTKQLEKISSQMQNSGGELDDLLSESSILESIKWKSILLQQFQLAFKADVDKAINLMKALGNQCKPLLNDIIRVDKEVKANWDKYEKINEKLLRSSKDYEDAAITLEANLWNKESTGEQRNKNLQKLQHCSSIRNDLEAQTKLAISYYNNSLNNCVNLMTSGTATLQSVFKGLFDLTKDLQMKTLVYEISQTRNLQYDSEQFFKELEKYEETVNPSQIVVNKIRGYIIKVSGVGLQLYFSKDNYEKMDQLVNKSFLKQIADSISSNNNINIRRDISQLESDNKLYSAFSRNETLKQDLKLFITQTIQAANKIKVRSDQTENPINKELSADTIIRDFQNSDLNNEFFGQLFGFIKLSLCQAFDPLVLECKQIQQDYDIQYLMELLNNKINREIACIILECFRLSGQAKHFIILLGFKKMIYFCNRLIETISRECELSLLKRVVLMISTIYKIDEHNKERRIYLQEVNLN